MKTALLFPGQGAQKVGMAKDIVEKFPAAAQVFEKANEILEYDLKKFCFEGPKEKLDLTKISQPAIFTTSAAILEVLREKGVIDKIKPSVSAGLSLGEYTAIYAAGSISFEDGLRLVQSRGNAMQQAADNTEGSMVSIIGLAEEKVKELCREAGQGQILKGVNYNCPGQIVISGESEACKRALELAEKYGAMKAVPLAVAGAFHTELMQSAADDLEKALEKCNIKEPAGIKILANVSADFYFSAEEIKEGLVKQLTSPILWQKSMEKLLGQGFEDFYEIGPSRVLTGLMKRIERKIKVKNVSKSKSLEKLLN